MNINILKGNMTTIYYSAERCAAGKSHAQRDRIVTTPGLYLLAVDRREMIGEAVRKLREQAVQACTSPVIREVYSRDQNHPDGSASVRVDVEALPSTYTTGHIVVVTTHEALRLSDLSRFEGWTCCIDEAPNAFFREELVTHALGSAWFAARYELIPSDDGRPYAQVRAYSDAPAAADVASDTIMRSLDLFHRRVVSGRTPVYVDIRAWDEMDDRKRAWTWHSLWLPTELDAFDRVEIVANAFDDSVTALIWRNRCPRVGFVPLPPLSAAAFAHRDLTIRYFAEAHGATGYLFDSTDGKARLGSIGKWMRQTDDQGRHLNVDPVNHIWTANLRQAEKLGAMPGQHLSPRQAGTDKFGALTMATMIYSAKPAPSEIAILETLGVSPAQVVKARETEDLVQFANRIGRRANDDRPLTITVYDRVQAEALQAYFDSVAHFRTNLVLVDLGFATAEAKRAGRPSKPKRTPEEEREHQREKKARQRAEAKAKKVEAA